MRLSELQSKSIVSVVDGKNIGNIIDVNVMMDGRIESLIIESGKSLYDNMVQTKTQLVCGSYQMQKTSLHHIFD